MSLQFSNQQQGGIPPGLPPGGFYPPIMNLIQAPGRLALGVAKPAICRRKFSKEEDELLKTLVNRAGETDWHVVAARMKNRTARQCRERWKHYLSPEISTGPWTEEEDELLLQKVKEMGSQWSRIARFFANRTDITVKNRWISLNSQQKRNQAAFLVNESRANMTREENSGRNLSEEKTGVMRER
jgi:hypothetical protein